AQRVVELVKACRGAGGKLGALGSSIRSMDRQGVLGGEISWNISEGNGWTLVRGEWNVHGCGLAVRRDCCSAVGPIRRQMICGEIALWMRAAFLREGGLACVPQVLVCYRTHINN